MSRAREFADLAGSADAGGITGKNLIINGAMKIAQRSVSETAQHTSGYITCDRFLFNFVNEDALRLTVTQEADGPSGFSNSLKLQTTTAEPDVAADEELRVIYRAEGQDLQSLGFGTSAAKKFTVSFYVKSSVAATYGFNAYIYDANKIFGQAYTINSANTWERKSITFDANTSDIITDDNTVGLQFNWFLMAGSNYTSGSNSSWETYAQSKQAVGHTANAVSTTTNATWQITGVQMEVGEQATPFQHEDIGTTLAKCQRYYQRIQCDTAYDSMLDGMHLVTTQFYTMHTFPVQMRAVPTMSGTGTFSVMSNGADRIPDSLVLNRATKEVIQTYSALSGGNVGTAGHGGHIRNYNDADTFLEFIAEL